MTPAKVAAYGGAAVVGAVAAVVSFGHLRTVALVAGEAELAAALLPVSVDGLLVSAAAVMVTDQTAGRKPRMSARVAFGIGCAATIGGNVASATPSPLGWAVAGWAPLALLLVTEMLARRGGRKVAEVAGTEPVKVAAELAGSVPATRPARKRAAQQAPARERVARAAARRPAATVAELAAAARVSERTARRYLAGQAPAPVPASNGSEPAELVAATTSGGGQ